MSTPKTTAKKKKQKHPTLVRYRTQVVLNSLKLRHDFDPAAVGVVGDERKGARRELTFRNARAAQRFYADFATSDTPRYIEDVPADFLDLTKRGRPAAR